MSCRRHCSGRRVVWRPSVKRRSVWRSGRRTFGHSGISKRCGHRDRIGIRKTGEVCVQDDDVPEDYVEGNVTDPDSRIMKTGAACWQQGYHVQAVVDGEEQLVVAAEVSADANDHGKLNAMVDEVAVVAGEPPEAVLADAGYASEKELAQLEERKVEGYVALGREGRSVRQLDSTRRPASAPRMAQRLTSREKVVRFMHSGSGWRKHRSGGSST